MSRPNVQVNGVVRVMNDAEFAQWTIDSASALPPVEILKSTIVNRIIAAGKATQFAAVLAGLDAATALRWQSVTVIYQNEPVAASICSVLGLDVNVIMRPGADT